MSFIDNLFGKVDSGKIESNVSDIFNQESKPVDNLSIQAKIRTILPAIKQKREKKARKANKEENEEENEEESKEDEPAAKKQKKTSENDDDLEGRYFAKLMKDDKDPSGENKDGEPKKVRVEKAKKIDLKEDELEKAERTVFVGNLTSEVITSKTTYKLFKKLFSTNPNPAEDEEVDEKKDNPFSIESIRFRSISFDEALPRKVAFTQQKLHKSRESVNAYIVYKNKTSVRPILKKLNANVFENRHLRVDSVVHPAPHEKQRSLFVGNLDFEEDEESLWKHFKNCGEIEYVRIIRDSSTNMGKGFAYVQFYELQSVTKALLLNEKPMVSVGNSNKRGRKLRISRCKNMRKEKGGNNNSYQNERINNKFSKLNESQKTKMGRAGKVLGKADRATLGKTLTIEGQRAKKGDSASSHLKRKKQRSKAGRVTKRSIAYKKTQVNEQAKN